MFLTQPEVDFLKSSLNKTLNGLNESRKDYKIEAKRLKSIGAVEESDWTYRELARIDIYRAKFAEIQRKLKRGIITEHFLTVTGFE